jgi:predicted  nucleic acid-binding Zn-ribbon protein
MPGLRSCPSCSKKISEFAVVCPFCGWNKREQERIEKEELESWQREKRIEELKLANELAAKERKKREQEEEDRREREKRDKWKTCLGQFGCLALILGVLILPATLAQHFTNNIVIFGLPALIVVLIFVIMSRVGGKN